MSQHEHNEAHRQAELMRAAFNREFAAHEQTKQQLADALREKAEAEKRIPKDGAS